MPTKKPNAEQVWKQFEDHLAPRLGLCTIGGGVYSHLLRHSRLEGQLRLQFALSWLARGTDLSRPSVREAVRRLIGHRVLRLVQRSKAGHVVEVRIPSEVRAARPGKIARRAASNARAFDLDNLDFLKSPELRRAIFAREGGRCFYCLSRVTPQRAAWITSSRLQSSGTIPGATWFPAATSATPRKTISARQIFSGGYIASAA